jgi:dissimilatory sulfite reductase (desulfoviridin) alpha/beta subunit
MKVTEAEFQLLKTRDVNLSLVHQPRHKFRAKPSDEDGIHFASKKERAYYRVLKLRQKSGEVLFFLRQAPFHLPGNVRHVIDFIEFWADGTVHFVEIKGFDTPMGKLKRKQVMDIYPIVVEIK